MRSAERCRLARPTFDSVRKIRTALLRAALPARSYLLAISASHLQPKPDDLHDVDRKRNSVKKKHRIKVSCDAIEDEQDVACDRKPTQRHDRIHAKSCEHGQRCQVSDKIDPGHPATLWLQWGRRIGARPATSGPRPVTSAS